MSRVRGIEVLACERCPALVESRSQIVNGAGPEDADLLFVGEGPGEREDAEGEPFVGPSGRVLDESLREAGLDRADIRISNCIRCRPPDNRDPHADELDNCRGYLEAEIAEVAPAVIVTLGKVPSQHLLGRDVAVTNEAGTVERVALGGTERDVLVCVHPAASFYDRSQRETLEEVVAKAAAMAGADQSQLGDY